jgi:hypothetical protein
VASFAGAFQKVSDFEIESRACRWSFFHFSLQIAKCSIFRIGATDYHLGIWLPPGQLKRKRCNICTENRWITLFVDYLTGFRRNRWPKKGKCPSAVSHYQRNEAKDTLFLGAFASLYVVACPVSAIIEVSKLCCELKHAFPEWKPASPRHSGLCQGIQKPGPPGLDSLHCF